MFLCLQESWIRTSSLCSIRKWPVDTLPREIHRTWQPSASFWTSLLTRSRKPDRIRHLWKRDPYMQEEDLKIPLSANLEWVSRLRRAWGRAGILLVKIWWLPRSMTFNLSSIAQQRVGIQERGCTSSILSTSKDLGRSSMKEKEKSWVMWKINQPSAVRVMRSFWGHQPTTTARARDT